MSKQEFQVAIYQYEARREAPEERIARLGNILDRRRDARFDLVVCPELFLSGYGPGIRFEELAESIEGKFARAIAELARTTRTAVCYGYPELDQGKVYNSAACFDKNGELVANHRKLLLPTTTALERQSFSKGSALTTFELEGCRFGLLICYEVEFPELVRALAATGCAMVIVPTALIDKWALVANQMVPSRAFENGLYLAYANYAGTDGDTRYLGASVIVAPDGRELARAENHECLISAAIDPIRAAIERDRHSYLANREAAERIARDLSRRRPSVHE